MLYIICIDSSISYFIWEITIKTFNVGNNGFNFFFNNIFRLRNIVYNPRDAKSYLYLAKIYKKEENKMEEEKNINTTLLLEPRNEEAMYLLIDIEISRSNFSKLWINCFIV